MKKTLKTAWTVILVMICTLAARGQAGQGTDIVINADQGTDQISRHIYGHFSEHLGRCIYGGFWVGEDSDIPHTRGIRNEVVEALKKTSILMVLSNSVY